MKPKHWRDCQTNEGREYDWLHTEAGKIQRRAKKHGKVSVILDSEGQFHALPGVVEIIGTYDSRVELSHLLQDLGLSK